MRRGILNLDNHVETIGIVTNKKKAIFGKYSLEITDLFVKKVVVYIGKAMYDETQKRSNLIIGHIGKKLIK